jgi:tetratricopeptide (TPR) repeat protein
MDPMNRLLTLMLCAIAVACGAHAQQADRAIREGNSAYRAKDLQKAIQRYGQAQADPRGAFNLGNAHYRLDSVAQAQRNFEAASTLAKDPAAQARAFHNLGNSWMKQQKWQEAINAYKQSLKRMPDDDETRYNLAYAQKKLQEEKNKDKQDQQKDQNKDQQQQQQQQQPKQQDQQQQKQPGQIDKQDAQRMLDAMQQQEKNTQEKAREKMRVRVKKPIEKDW